MTLASSPDATLDKKGPDLELVEELVLPPESSGSGISMDARRMLEAIENLPDDEREVFSLVQANPGE